MSILPARRVVSFNALTTLGFLEETADATYTAREPRKDVLLLDSHSYGEEV